MRSSENISLCSAPCSRGSTSTLRERQLLWFTSHSVSESNQTDDRDVFSQGKLLGMCLINPPVDFNYFLFFLAGYISPLAERLSYVLLSSTCSSQTMWLLFSVMTQIPEEGLGASRGSQEAIPISPTASLWAWMSWQTQQELCMQNDGRLRPIKLYFNNTTRSYPWFIERHLIIRTNTVMAAGSANPSHGE